MADRASVSGSNSISTSAYEVAWLRCERIRNLAGGRVGVGTTALRLIGSPSPAAVDFTGETDSLAEGEGFEPLGPE